MKQERGQRNSELQRQDDYSSEEEQTETSLAPEDQEATDRWFHRIPLLSNILTVLTLDPESIHARESKKAMNQHMNRIVNGFGKAEFEEMCNGHQWSQNSRKEDWEEAISVLSKINQLFYELAKKTSDAPDLGINSTPSTQKKKKELNLRAPLDYTQIAESPLLYNQIIDYLDLAVEVGQLSSADLSAQKDEVIDQITRRVIQRYGAALIYLNKEYKTNFDVSSFKNKSTGGSEFRFKKSGISP
jgi:hypothetical protein